MFMKTCLMGLAVTAVAATECNHQNKQKALYLQYDFEPSLKDVPATDISVEVNWNSTADIRKWGKNGIFASQTIGSADGPGGYFGSQVTGGSTEGQLIFSVWDEARKQGMCAHPSQAPNTTWCAHQHSFPLSGTCRRHCLDCGDRGWSNSTGTQCKMPIAISAGDSFRFRFWRSNASTTHVFEGITYKGSVWSLMATPLQGDATPVMVGEMFWEDTFEGLKRFGAFHEHIGCVLCDSFYESEVRTGPFIAAPQARTVSNIHFKNPEAECKLYDVKVDNDKHSAQFFTGPGTGPSQ